MVLVQRGEPGSMLYTLYNDFNTCLHIIFLLHAHTDQSKIDLLEEPNGIATAPSMMSLYSQLEDVAPSSTEQDVSPLCVCVCV